MTTTNQKQEIVRSLSNLDAAQSEQVLNFIRGLISREQNDLYHQYLKRKAIQEIGRALEQAPQSF
jgi:hypothetical protein